MNSGLVSVIVPVYKVEKYLDRCVSSIVSQTYSNLEILLIDDGSPDRCPQMCDAWAAKDSRIRVIHKQNEGLGMARNTGIDHAQGEYICFFDSDDYVDLNTIAHAVTQCEREKADIAVFGFVISDAAGEPTAYLPPKPKKTVYSGAEVQAAFLPDLIGTDPGTGRNTNLFMSACCCLYSLEMIRSADWRFSSEREIISEDVYSLLGLYSHVRKVVVLEEALYYYCENQVSLTHAYRQDRFEKIKTFYGKCVERCRDCGYPPEAEKRCAEPFLSFVIAALKQEAAYHSDKREAVARVRRIAEDPLVQRILTEKKQDKVGAMRKVLFWTMRHRLHTLCYCLLKARSTAAN